MSIILEDASRGRRGSRLAVALAGVVATALAAEQPGAGSTAGTPPKPEATFGGEVAVAWILVPVSVKLRSGFVRGLDRGDFELRVDGKLTRFADFESRGEVPWSLVFLQDLSGSMEIGGRLESSRQAVSFFLDQAKPGDEFALASFAGEVTAVDVPFTEAQEPLREMVGRWEAYGKTALHDAVALLPQISGESRNVKRAVVLVTDGVDNASQISATQAREIVGRAEIPVFVLGLESGDPYALSIEGKKIFRYADVLNLLSAMTGGRYFAIHGPDDLKEACASIAEELRYQYVLGFETATRGESRFRPISVAVRKRDMKVEFRHGYSGTPPAP